MYALNLDISELFNVGALVTFARENVETLLSVLDSIWLILKGNISLAFESFTALVAILFGGGTAVINFFVNLVSMCTNSFHYILLRFFLDVDTPILTTFKVFFFMKKNKQLLF